jgi:hypothetical protein
MLVTTVLQNKIGLRMCLINPRTTFEDVLQTIKKGKEIGAKILASKL